MTTVNIPGTFLARINNGRIEGFLFIPSASDAGYFGEAYHVVDGIDDLKEEMLFDMVSNCLMFTEDRQSATFTCEWSS